MESRCCAVSVEGTPELQSVERTSAGGGPVTEAPTPPATSGRRRCRDTNSLRDKENKFTFPRMPVKSKNIKRKNTA